jgi:hypothetical protein
MSLQDSEIRTVNHNQMQEPLLRRKFDMHHKIGISGVLLSTLLILVVFILAIITLVAVNKNYDDLNTKLEKLMKKEVSHMPSEIRKFFLPQQAYTPVVSQGSRGTCWLFAQVGVLESSYRLNGYSKGFLAANEYVKFSEQGFAKKYVDYCQAMLAAVPSGGKFDDWCRMGGMLGGPKADPNDMWGIGTTDDGEIELMYDMWDNVHTGLYPESVCYYSPYPGKGNESLCEHEAEAKLSNPLSWRVTDMTTAYDVGRAKEIIHKCKNAVAFSSVLYSNVFTIKCDDPNASQYIKDSNECKKCIWKRVDGTCEYKLVIREYDWGGHFINHFLPYQDFLRIGGGHAQTLVGYNDEWVTDLFGFGDPKDYEKGAFILKNSWGADKGHSVDYLMGHISMIEERSVCPMHGDPKYWIPIDPDCLRNENNTAANCSQSQKQLLGNTWRYGATALQCKDPSHPTTFFGIVTGTPCDVTKTYYLSSYSADEYNNTVQGAYVDGVPAGAQSLANKVWVQKPYPDRNSLVFKIVEYDNVTRSVNTFLTNESSWWVMGYVFTPMDFVHNDEHLCGFYPMPYSTMAKDNVYQPENDKDTNAITCFDIEWDDVSYVKNDNGAFNYSFLKNSTKTDHENSMVGPFGLYPAANKYAVPHHEL